MRGSAAPCYYDPVLRPSRCCYDDLVRKLHGGGLIALTRRPLSRVGALCVNKKNGRLRLEINCRATNRRFRPTPLLPMGTGAVWADVCLTEEEEAWFPLSDIEDFLFECSIPLGLRRFLPCWTSRPF